MARRNKRRHTEEEHENHERWLVSYADFITLLFAFFVVMYAISSINEGKYRVLSSSITSAFHSTSNATAAGGQVILMQGTQVPQVQQPPINLALERQKTIQREKMKGMAEKIFSTMAPLIRQGKVRVLETSRGITVEINDSLLFAPGQARLESASVNAMLGVAQVVASSDFPVTIEGHTDDIPISTPQFPSNWELSAVRATTVLRLFVDAGVSASRLTAIGYGDQHPVESNSTPDGRARNRRVNILIDSARPEEATEVGTVMTEGSGTAPATPNVSNQAESISR